MNEEYIPTSKICVTLAQNILLLTQRVADRPILLTKCKECALLLKEITISLKDSGTP